MGNDAAPPSTQGEGRWSIAREVMCLDAYLTPGNYPIGVLGVSCVRKKDMVRASHQVAGPSINCHYHKWFLRLPLRICETSKLLFILDLTNDAEHNISKSMENIKVQRIIHKVNNNILITIITDEYFI